MKKLIYTMALLMLSNFAYCQSVTGWYIVTHGCEWGLLAPSATDIGEALPDGGSIKKEAIESFIDEPNKYKNSAVLSEGEVVFVINKIKDVFYCYTILGRLVAVKGTPLKVEPTGNTGIGLLNEEITLLSGKTITTDCVWIVSQDLGKQTLTIQIGENEKYEIPQSKCDILNPMLVNTVKELKFKKVE